MGKFPHNMRIREAARKKKRSNFGTFPRGGGVMAQSKVKGAVFAIFGGQ